MLSGGHSGCVQTNSQTSPGKAKPRCSPALRARGWPGPCLPADRPGPWRDMWRRRLRSRRGRHDQEQLNTWRSDNNTQTLRAFLVNGSASPEQQHQPNRIDRSCRRHVRGCYGFAPPFAGLVPISQAVLLRCNAIRYREASDATFSISIRTITDHASPQTQAPAAVSPRLDRATCRIHPGSILRH